MPCTLSERSELPELPEIEHLKRTLEPVLVGSEITTVRILRRDILHRGSGYEKETARIKSECLLARSRIIRLDRYGKQLALSSESGKVLCIHLGMSGQLQYLPTKSRLENNRHVHCIWTIRGPKSSGRLIFRDPRRFGGIWVFATLDELHISRWSRLGPDALDIRSRSLFQQLIRTRKSIKSALLDQSLIAGVGNIYADECLFASGIHPSRPSNELSTVEVTRLAKHLRKILQNAIRAGGSTIHSYIDGNGEVGTYVSKHQVYGRAHMPCVKCCRPLCRTTIAQRTTVFCSTCQRAEN